MRMIGKMAAWMTAVWMTAACTGMTAHYEKGELFPDGKPLGQPFSPTQTHIRMVRVDSVQEADSFFLALCRKTGYAYFATYYRPNGRSMLHYRHKLSGGEVFYTHHTPAGTYEVGIIYIRDSVTNAKGIREVHFVETVKPPK